MLSGDLRGNLRIALGHSCRMLGGSLVLCALLSTAVAATTAVNKSALEEPCWHFWPLWYSEGDCLAKDTLVAIALIVPAVAFVLASCLAFFLFVYYTDRRGQVRQVRRIATATTSVGTVSATPALLLDCGVAANNNWSKLDDESIAQIAAAVAKGAAAAAKRHKRKANEGNVSSKSIAVLDLEVNQQLLDRQQETLV